MSLSTTAKYLAGQKHVALLDKSEQPVGFYEFAFGRYTLYGCPYGG
jgi:hypothetical protein